ncbi:MAG: hypothetical protein M1818_000840 [Claussenomyces sp. TS43310]|nr:MAG: hypothetical protein M1818_000840 [Claussenomyces sp. TS43310]
MLKLFGFPWHIAPGEAEAECALLQREGIVDAVLSEDVDTLMFGCRTTFRNWTCEGSAGNHAPTHVSVYDANATLHGRGGLDREGMILVALMSGGDYDTDGITGCGIKVACEAARAGYGKSLCRLSDTDIAGFDAWRRQLSYDLLCNEAGHFRTKHKTIKVPQTFPDMGVLGYYTNPVVSAKSKLMKLKAELKWNEVDVVGLRSFVAEVFEWSNKLGAQKFVRGLAPALLVTRLLARQARETSKHNHAVLTTVNETELVQAICGRRVHFSTDGILELRLIYQPLDIVPINLTAEYDNSTDNRRDGLTPIRKHRSTELTMSKIDPAPREQSKRAGKEVQSAYDPLQPRKAWVSEIIARIGIPLKVEDYEKSLRDPQILRKKKAAAKKVDSRFEMPRGAFNQHSITARRRLGVGVVETSDPIQSSTPALARTFLAPFIDKHTISRSLHPASILADPYPLSDESNHGKVNDSTPVPRSRVFNPVTVNPRGALASPPSAPSQDRRLSGTGTSFSVVCNLACRKTPRRCQTYKSEKPSSSQDILLETHSIARPFSYLPLPSQDLKLYSDFTLGNSHLAPKAVTQSSSSTIKQCPRSLTRNETPPRSQETSNAHINFGADTPKADTDTQSASPNAIPALCEDIFTAVPTTPCSMLSRALQNRSSSEHTSQDADISDFISCPSPSSEPTARTISTANTLNSIPMESKSQVQEKRVKRFFRLRQSLEGSWEEVQESGLNKPTCGENRTSRRIWRRSEVEVLDLTEE